MVTASEIRGCEACAIIQIGLPSMVLMERAAMGVVEELTNGCYDLLRVLVVSGNGNNGGDGFAAARLLRQHHVNVRVLFVGDDNSCTAETAQQKRIAQNCGVEVIHDADFNDYTTLVDALFGTGLSREVTGDHAKIIEKMNQSAADIVSVDIPSGISADTGRILGVAVRAKTTVTFSCKKVGLVLYPGAAHAGLVRVKDIGIPQAVYECIDPRISSHTCDDLIKIPKRNPYSNKGTFGKVLVVAGSVNMSGAAYLAAKAAYRTGAGLVRIYTPGENRGILQTQLPEAILTTYDPDCPDIRVLREVMDWASVIIAGPGLGRGARLLSVLETLITDAAVPLILDADALNLMADHPDLPERHRQPVLLTPHLGEMARLTRKSIAEIAENLMAAAETLAREKQAICILKDARTVVTSGDGRFILNQSGSSGMATGGSGDVLTGILAGLIAQGKDPKEAASLGVYIHGLAGDAASAVLGPHGVMAGDIADSISTVMKPYV